MQKQIALLVIGDEILSGRTQDVNVQVLALHLDAIGAKLAEVRVIPDEENVIVPAIQQLSKTYDYLFTSGGIGPTHDDITADCVARAFGVSIDVREDAKALLATNYKGGAADLTDARLRMARIPDGASLIDNPISKAPGFRIENCFTLAGVPQIFKAMLDHALSQIEVGEKMQSETVTIHLPESKIADPLRAIAEKYPTLNIGSYPQEDQGRYWAEIVVKGFDQVQIRAAIDEVKGIRG